MRDSQIVTKPSEALKLLWKGKMFFRRKSLSEVQVELEKRGYNFTIQAVDMALKGAKFLTRRGRKGDFKYVQKYPFFETK